MQELQTIGYGERYLLHARTVFGRSPFAVLPGYASLALEMAAHEETERRALEGELEHLEMAWREAEEIAAIADRLPDQALPASTAAEPAALQPD